MDIGSILIIAALLIPVGIFIAKPLLEGGGDFATEEEIQASAMLAERDRILDAIQELDFDHRLGKIPEEEFQMQRGLLLQQGAGVLKTLDELNLEPAAQLAREQTAGPASVSDRQTSEPPDRLLPPDDDIERIIAVRRRERREQSGGFCPQCGHAVQRSDQFCSRCGTVLKTGVKSQ